MKIFYFILMIALNQAAHMPPGTLPEAWQYDSRSSPESTKPGNPFICFLYEMLEALLSETETETETYDPKFMHF